MSKFKQILSYVWDIPIERTGSDVNPYLEVVWSNGKKMLNTREANFSFGNGFGVFQKAMQLTAAEIRNAQRILILGFGCGSIVKLLEDEHHYAQQVTGIEYDQVILDLYDRHFARQHSLKPELLCRDAEEFVSSTDEVFDLIFIDLFAELNTIPFVFSSEFTQHLKERCPSGTLVYNLVQRGTTDQNNIQELTLQLSSWYRNVEQHPFQDINRILIAK